jgi:hypothetical protein
MADYTLDSAAPVRVRDDQGLIQSQQDPPFISILRNYLECFVEGTRGRALQNASTPRLKADNHDSTPSTVGPRAVEADENGILTPIDQPAPRQSRREHAALARQLARLSNAWLLCFNKVPPNPPGRKRPRTLAGSVDVRRIAENT